LFAECADVFLIIYGPSGACGLVAETAIVGASSSDRIQEVQCVRSNHAQFGKVLSLLLGEVPFGIICESPGADVLETLNCREGAKFSMKTLRCVPDLKDPYEADS
jgi:hypothetical protein